MGIKLTKVWEDLKENFEETVKNESLKVTPKMVAIGVDPRSPVFHEQFERTPLQLPLDDSKSVDGEQKLGSTSTPVTIKSRSNRPLDQMRSVFKRRESEIKTFE